MTNQLQIVQIIALNINTLIYYNVISDKDKIRGSLKLNEDGMEYIVRGSM